MLLQELENQMEEYIQLGVARPLTQVETQTTKRSELIDASLGGATELELKRKELVWFEATEPSTWRPGNHLVLPPLG